LDLRGRKWQEVGEDCVMRSCIIYMSSNIVEVIKSRRMKWVGHVELMGEMRKHNNFVGKP